MGHRIFLAGASGAIGKRLLPLLRDAGHQVIGTIRSAERAPELRALGADPVVLDVFDARALERAVVSARPEIVVHQLTDLPQGLDPRSRPARHLQHRGAEPDRRDRKGARAARLGCGVSPAGLTGLPAGAAPSR
jgi:nucleoside-diphosphate-sugar epimerase